MTTPRKENDWRERFEEAYVHWIENYVCTPDAFDMDLRHSVARDEIKEIIISLLSEIVEEMEASKVLTCSCTREHLKINDCPGWSEEDAAQFNAAKDADIAIIRKRMV